MKKLNELLGRSSPLSRAAWPTSPPANLPPPAPTLGRMGVIATGGMLEADLLRQQIRICKS